MKRQSLPGLTAARAALVDGAATALRGGLQQLVRRNLRGVWVRGELPVAGAVWASNHHSWWDFFVAMAAMKAENRSDVGVLMEAANIGMAEVYREFGALGAHQLRAAVDKLRGGAVLVIFPEGEIRSAGPLGPTQRGAGWLATNAEVPLLPVATRVVLRGQQAPEAYLVIGQPMTSTGELPQVLADALSALDAELAAADPEQPLPGFRQVVRGVRSWNEKFAALGGAR